MVERIEWQDQTLALIIRDQYQSEGVDFVTPRESSLQLGVINRVRGESIKPHLHISSPRTIKDIQEVLHIKSGRVEAQFYDEDGHVLLSTVLNPGDTILLMSGGHGFSILENARIIEVKQGPYQGIDQDKKRLETSE